MSAHEAKEVPNINGVWEYRGVMVCEDSFRGGWHTYSMILSKTPPRGTTRLHARTRAGVFKLIDRHLDSGGEISRL